MKPTLLKYIFILLLAILMLSCNKQENSALQQQSTEFPAWKTMTFFGDNNDIITPEKTFGKFTYLDVKYKFTIEGEKITRTDKWYYPITITGGYTTTYAYIGKYTTNNQYFINILMESDNTFMSDTYTTN